MGEFKGKKPYQPNGPLSKELLDTTFDSIEDWVNAREIDAFNIAPATLEGTRLNAQVVDGTTLELRSNKISIQGGSFSEVDFTETVSGVKIAAGSLSIAKVAPNFVLGPEATNGTDDLVKGGAVTAIISKPTAVLVQCVSGSSSVASTLTDGFIGTENTNTVIFTLFKDDVALGVYHLQESARPGATPPVFKWPLNSLAWVYYENTPGEHTYTISIQAAGASLKLRLMVVEL